MSQGRFANQRALIEYAEAHDLSYAWGGSPAFAKRSRLAQPGQYELVEVPTKRGVVESALIPAGNPESGI
jgi:hypothetical protein